MTYWLRDLEMEKYNLRFARDGVTDLEDLTLLKDEVLSQGWSIAINLQ